MRAEIERRSTEAAEGETWVLGELDGPAGHEIVLADAALKRIDHPFADHHVTVEILLDDTGGLPDESAADALNAEEDNLVASLQGTAVYAGRTTRPGLRTLHFVTDNPDQARAAIQAWAQGLPHRRVKVRVERDVNWSFQRALGIR